MLPEALTEPESVADTIAKSLNTMGKLKAYLGKTYTSEQVTALIEKLGIIKHKGVLAQPIADGGSILNWEKATIKETASTATTKKFTLNVPLGNTKEVETLQGELRYEKSKGWRVYSLETILNGDTPPAITLQQARSLFEDAKNSYWYVVMGGEGKRNEATFTRNDMEYRYMAESLNTMGKLKTYLGKTYTSEQVTALIKKLGIIERKGVLDQPFSSEETRNGAINRAKNTSIATNADFSFGLEGGVEEIDGIMYCVNWGAVALKNGTIYTAAGASFMLPEEIAVQLREGRELGPVMDRFTSKKNIRHHEGAVGIFTSGLINRKQMFEHIVTLLVGQVYYYEQLEMITEN